MNKSSFGSHFTVTTWGESHGKALGAVIDGCPAGLSLSEEDIQKFLDRRKPGQSRYTTARKEGDLVEILSGVFEGKTTGTPISLMVRNTDQRSRDYGNIAYSYRPGHADYTFDAKYGFRDYRGGGRSSGRETIGRVASGAVASKLLASLGISFCTYTKSIGPVSIENFSPEEINNNDEIWSYWGEQTKEVRFIPSLVSNKRQIAFILNMDSDYAKKLAYNDVWNLDFDKETVKSFLDYRYIEKFINEDRIKRDVVTTDRESAIMFGLPINLVEGVFVGRKIEKDNKALNYIKSKLPDCYVCNLDGKVIVSNK